MDDLSINISGLAPAAARTVRAVAKPRGQRLSGYASKVKDFRSRKRPREEREVDVTESRRAKAERKAKLKAERNAKREVEKGKYVSVVGPKVEKSFKAGKNRIASEMKFKSIKLHESLQRQLEYLNFLDCTPIQALAVPRGLTGKKDLMLRAPTGSGKTLAFLLPVIHQLLCGDLDRSKGTLATILSPTKELALQTLKVATGLCRMVPSLVCGAVAGGEKPKSEKARLRKGLSLLCATPGRIAYHLEHTATFIVRHMKCLVLDEADRLLDMGFEPQVRSIHRKILEAAKDGEVQTMLVSATLVPAVRELAEFCLRPKAFWADAEGRGEAKKADGTVGVGEELNFAAPSTLTQWYCAVPGKERLTALLAAIMSRVGKKKSIIFFSTGASVDFHCDLLLEATWPPRAGLKRRARTRPELKQMGKFVGLAKDAKELQEEEEEEEEEEVESGPKMFAKTEIFKLHGSLSKEERAGYIADFLKVPGGILLASDAASRGLDFPQIDWIIQYDPPQRTEEYLHRVGRTARIGKAGSALLLLQPSELGFLDVLRGRGLTDLREMALEDLVHGLEQKAPKELRGLRDLQAVVAGHLSSRVAAQSLLLSRARSAYLSSLKAYRSFPRELRSCFPFQELHLGHLATSFALREAPREVVKKERYERTSAEEPTTLRKGKVKAKGREKGKAKGKGVKGKGKGKAAGKATPKLGAPDAADEFAA